jgi:hypothetical protein
MTTTPSGLIMRTGLTGENDEKGRSFNQTDVWSLSCLMF